MNEKIKELAEQCHHRYSEWHIDLEKFAELIIKECANVGSKSMYPDSDPDYVGRNIRQHFGVEE